MKVVPSTLRKVLRRWRRGRIAVYHHPSYRLPLASDVGAPMAPRRADDALTWAVDAGLVDPSDVVSAEELSYADAALVHGEAYLASLDRPEVVARIVGAEPWRVPVREVVETWRRGAWSTVDAARRVVRGPVRRAVNLLGGFHHAEPDRGGGFCAFADIPIAIARMRTEGLHGLVVIVDLDAHPPDGIVACVHNDARIVIRSVSTASGWTVPASSAATVVDARVPAGAKDAAYLAAVDAALRGVDALGAELAFYLAGGDPLDGDKLGGLAVSLDGLRERDRRVFAALGATPTVVVPAGGYSNDSWRVLAGTLAAATGSSAEIPADYEPHGVRTRRVMRALDPKDLGGAGEGALITEQELMGSLGAAPRGEPRLLGYYTRHGLEHALTAYGYLDAIRRLGFSGLEVSLVEGVGGPDRMQITAEIAPPSGDGPPTRETVVDLAVSIRPVHTFRALFIEWLELRDPRSAFASHRPRLPGQAKPGLGLSDETMYLLLRASERLGLDGVALVPSHWHVAAILRRRFVVVDPDARGRYRALLRIVDGVPLRTASLALGGAGLPTETGEMVRWEPVMLAAPGTAGFRAWLDEGEPRAQAVEQGWLDLLLPWEVSAGSVAPGGPS